MTNTDPRAAGDVGAAAALLRRMRPVDLAPTLARGIPRWPTHPYLIIDQTVRHERDGYYCQNLNMAEHIGCHVDAPAHTVPWMMEATVEKLPVDQLIAEAVVYDFSDRNLGPGEMLTPDDFTAYERQHGVAVEEGQIALVNYGWLKRHWRTDNKSQYFATNCPGMTEESVIFLKERKVRAVGGDTICCEGALDGGKLVLGRLSGHREHWLPHNILILECVANLELVTKRCLFLAAALPIEHGSGSPIRPIAYCSRDD